MDTHSQKLHALAYEAESENTLTSDQFAELIDLFTRLDDSARDHSDDEAAQDSYFFAHLELCIYEDLSPAMIDWCEAILDRI
jgi:hypothetical protein